MNIKQGFSPIEGTGLNISQNSPALFPEQRISKPIEPRSPFDGNSLVRSILFVCKECNGPLAPSSSCIVCKRILRRQCTRCGNEVHNGTHVSCEYLVSLGKLRTNKPDKKQKREVEKRKQNLWP